MKRPRKNFTLIEIVIATAIMVVVAMIIGTAGSAFYKGYRRMIKNSRQLQEYMAIDRIFDDGVRNAVPFKWTDTDGVSRFIFWGEADRVLFTCLRRADGDAPGGIMFIRLSIEDEKLIAEYSYYPRLPWLEEGEEEMGRFKKEVLAENVESVSFLYAEDNGDADEPLEWLDVWEEEEHAAIPLAIRMKVVWNDGSQETWLRRVAGVSGTSTFCNRANSSTIDNSKSTKLTIGGN